MLQVRDHGVSNPGILCVLRFVVDFESIWRDTEELASTHSLFRLAVANFPLGSEPQYVPSGTLPSLFSTRAELYTMILLIVKARKFEFTE